MARPKSLKPAYCRHKPSGRAYVRLAGDVLDVDLSRGITRSAHLYHHGRVPKASMGRELKGSTIGVIGYGAIGFGATGYELALRGLVATLGPRG